jgi:hypothetical protein
MRKNIREAKGKDGVEERGNRIVGRLDKRESFLCRLNTS